MSNIQYRNDIAVNLEHNLEQLLSKQGIYANNRTEYIKNKSKVFVKPPKVLLVEDHPLIQTLHTEILSQLGCTVDIASNGHEAIAMSKQNYDLIFMDIGLPNLDGIASIKAIRDQEPSNHPNIIIVLTAYSKTLEEKCRNEGANDFYTMPILSDTLLHILMFWLPHLLVKSAKTVS